MITWLFIARIVFIEPSISSFVFINRAIVIRINTNALSHGQVNGQLDKNTVMYADTQSCSQTVNQTYRRVDGQADIRVDSPIVM